MDRLSSSASTASSIDDYSERKKWNPLLELFFLEHVIHSLVILLLIYSVTRRNCSSLHDDTLGTIAPGIPFLCGTIAALVI